MVTVANRLTDRQNFYPRSPRGERPIRFQLCYSNSPISIHAPREGSDQKAGNVAVNVSIFLSTLPARGATLNRNYAAYTIEFLSTLPARGATRSGVGMVPLSGKISIHAPREGSDITSRTLPSPVPNFYPRSPRGERLGPLMSSVLKCAFLSTLPARGATLR